MTQPSLSRDELVDMVAKSIAATEPASSVTPNQVDAAIEDVNEDGKVVFADPGKFNFVGEAILIKIAATVLTGLIVKAATAGGKAAWRHWVKRPPEQVADDLRVPSGSRKQAIAVIVFFQDKELDAVENRLDARGAFVPKKTDD
jgi:hypothetical protein